MSDYKFETLQLHVGLMYLRTLHMQQQDSDLQMQVTFTDV